MFSLKKKKDKIKHRPGSPRILVSSVDFDLSCYRETEEGIASYILHFGKIWENTLTLSALSLKFRCLPASSPLSSFSAFFLMWSNLDFPQLLR